jgi:hypothetical protein
MTVSALIFAVLAYGCAVNTAVTCDFVRVKKSPGYLLNDDLFENLEVQTGRLGIGLWNFEDILNNDDYYSSCIEFNNSNDDFLDAKWKAARSMSVVANACLGISVLSCIVMMCLALPIVFVKLILALLVLGCLCESLVFIAFASNVCDYISDCQFSSGAGTAVAASVLALIAAAFVSKLPQPHDKPDEFVPRSDEPGTVTVKTTVEPDGTTKTITSTVNADGSLTVVSKRAIHIPY